MHEFDSWLLYVHPPLAIAGYIFIIIALYLSLASQHAKGVAEKGTTGGSTTAGGDVRSPGGGGRMAREGAGAGVRTLGAAWLLTLLGLLTGMLWAQLAWGRYWGWDPKETTTLILFALLSIHLASATSDGMLAVLKRHQKAMHLAEAALMLVVLVSPTIASSLH